MTETEQNVVRAQFFCERKVTRELWGRGSGVRLGANRGLSLHLFAKHRWAVGALVTISLR